MLELNSNDVLRAATMLARLNTIMSGLTGAQNEALVPASVNTIVAALNEFRKEADTLGANIAVRVIDRAMSRITQEPCTMTVGEASAALLDVESRFGDHMVDVKMFAMGPLEAVFLQSADKLIENEGFPIKFPNASFELEEGSKCIALGRYTAAVFHAMRMLEYGIKALAKRLDIPDPTRAAEKNWGAILGAIQAKIDELWPKSSRLPNSEGAAFESLHTHLETVRNPWRNATMHVETIYAPHEALHILRCSCFFMVNLSKVTNEAGEAPGPEEAPRLPDITPGNALAAFSADERQPDD